MTTTPTVPVADPQPPPKVWFYPGKNMWVVEYYVAGQKAEKLFSNEDNHLVRGQKIKDFLDQLAGRTPTQSKAVA